MEKYIKPSMEMMKVEAHEALLSGSFNTYTNGTNTKDLAPRRKDFGDLSSYNYDVWEQWSDGTEDDEYAAVQVEASK